MKTGRTPTALGELLDPVSRPEKVDPARTYHLLGAHWYAKGLYTKEVLTGDQIRASNVYRVRAGDFVYNRLFGWKGSFALASPENDGCYVSNEFPCFAIRSDRLDGRFLALYFTRQAAWDEALHLSSGGTPTSRNRLKEEQFLSLKIPLPPLEEQRRIVARVEELSAKIEEARGLRRRALDGAKVVLGAGRRKIFGEAPADDWVSLNHYVSAIENGWSPSCEKRPAESYEWGVLKVGAVSFGTFDHDENKALPQSLEPKAEYEVRPGDFLMSRANTSELVGACALVSETRPRLMLSDKIFRFHFREDVQIDIGYMGHVLKSPALRYQIVRAATGTSPTMKNISKGKLLQLRVPRHPFREQRRIVEYLDELQAEVDSLRNLQEETSKELDALLPSILAKAFDGEI